MYNLSLNNDKAQTVWTRLQSVTLISKKVSENTFLFILYIHNTQICGFKQNEIYNQHIHLLKLTTRPTNYFFSMILYEFLLKQYHMTIPHTLIWHCALHCATDQHSSNLAGSFIVLFISQHCSFQDNETQRTLLNLRSPFYSVVCWILPNVQLFGAARHEFTCVKLHPRHILTVCTNSEPLSDELMHLNVNIRERRCTLQRDLSA